MAAAIKFRNLHWSDIPVFSRTLMNIWNLGRRPQMSRLSQSVAGFLYILAILGESEKVLVAVNNKPIGFCGYGLGKPKNFYFWLKKAILALLPAADRKLFQKFYKDSSYGELHASQQNAEITILIVAPQYYGTGLGRQLVEKVQKDAASSGCQSIFALTDSACHWHFYEKQGFKKVYEQEEPAANALGIKERQYIFQKFFDI